MYRRDAVLALIALSTAPLGALAQQPAPGIHRIGWLGPTSAASIAGRLAAFRGGMGELGYAEGKNLAIEYRWAEGKYDRLPELAAELVRLKVEVIVTHSTPGARAAKQATTSIPIVIAAQGDAVASGVVASLARPGGNITGTTFFGPQLLAKRLELLKEVLPEVRRFGVLSNPNTAPSPQEAFKVMSITARSLKVELHAFDANGPQAFEGVFAEMARQRIAAFTAQEEPMLAANVGVLARLAARHRIAAIGATEFADAGALLGYGPDFPALYRRAAVFVDRILKGAKPGDLPVEQPTKFEFVVNLKTALALGVKIPPSILLRADRVIE